MGNTTTRHIAEIAGVSVGSLYEYFENKEAVFDAMAERLIGDIVAMIDEATPMIAGMALNDAVLDLMQRFRDLLERDDGRYLQGVGMLLQGELQTRNTTINAALNNLALQFVARHPQFSRIRDLPALGYLIINGGVSVVVRHLSEPNPPISFDQLAHALARMIDHYADGELRLSENQQGAPHM